MKFSVFSWSRQPRCHTRYVVRHILHMNKLPIYFLLVILPISVYCKFQGVTCSNTLLWAGAAFLAAFWPYLLVDRCAFIASLLPYLLGFQDIFEILNFISLNFPVLQLVSSLTKLKICLDSFQLYARFPLIFIASVTTGLLLVLIIIN